MNQFYRTHLTYNEKNVWMNDDSVYLFQHKVAVNNYTSA